jgi:osmotically-inducible protein OsmY
MAAADHEGDAELAAEEVGRILQDAGIYIGAVVRDGQIFLEGEVESAADRDAALDVARAVAAGSGLEVVDELEIMTILPNEPWSEDESAGSEFRFAERSNRAEIEPDFIEREGTTDPALAKEGVPYFPPTDPVVEPTTDSEQLEIVGGFEGTSMDIEPGEQRPGALGDGEFEEIVRRELHEDALTTSLDIQVEVIDGVATLAGVVPTLEDAENAEAVAGRVPGILDVNEMLTVASMQRESDVE